VTINRVIQQQPRTIITQYHWGASDARCEERVRVCAGDRAEEGVDAPIAVLFVTVARVREMLELVTPP
jgi:hypothetical protein